MPIKIPESAAEVVARSKADVQRELQTANAFGKNHWIGAVVTGAANRNYDFYLQLSAAARENMPDTAVDNLVRWAAIWGKQPLAAEKAIGTLAASGVVGTVIPASTEIGNYISTSDAAINSNVINIDSLINSSGIVTAVTQGEHGLADGMFFQVTGATSALYNKTVSVISVPAADTFTYAIEGNPANEPTTSAIVTYSAAHINVVAKEFGEVGNMIAGGKVRLQSGIEFVNDILTVGYGGISGGIDVESNDSLRARMLQRIQNPLAHFNVAAIKEQVLEVAGVTRVFVEEVTPDIGQVTVYFMKDDRPNPIPSPAELVPVKDNILEIKPSNMRDSDVFVLSANPLPVDFSFISYGPQTESMWLAIQANLQQFFDETPVVGQDISEDEYRTAIFNTIDTTNGDRLQNFQLSSPIGDIDVLNGEIGVLGNVV